MHKLAFTGGETAVLSGAWKKILLGCQIFKMPSRIPISKLIPPVLFSLHHGTNGATIQTGLALSIPAFVVPGFVDLSSIVHVNVLAHPWTSKCIIIHIYMFLYIDMCSVYIYIYTAYTVNMQRQVHMCDLCTFVIWLRRKLLAKLYPWGLCHHKIWCSPICREFHLDTEDVRTRTTLHSLDWNFWTHPNETIDLGYRSVSVGALYQLKDANSNLLMNRGKCQQKSMIWAFPKIGVPQNHPFW